jgi:hypothetical protein
LKKPQRPGKPPQGPPIEQPPLPPPTLGTPLGFPKMWKWPKYSGSGGPIMTVPGVFDAAHVAAAAKWSMVAVNAVPFTNPSTPANIGIIAAMKAQNPNLVFVWLDSYQWKFQYSGANLWGDQWALMGSAPDKRFYKTGGGGVFWPFGDLLSCFYDVGSIPSETLALYRAYLVGNGADGIMFDTLVANAGAWYEPTSTLDLTLTPYTTLAQLNAACAAATTSIIGGLSDAGKLWGNRGAAPGYTSDAIMGSMTGEMIETWDPDWGIAGGTQIPLGGYEATGGNGIFHTFDEAMTRILSRQGTATSDGSVLLKIETGDNMGDASIVGTAPWNKVVRYSLACATIAGGMAHIGLGNARNNVNDVFTNADEYAVDATGHTDLAMQPQNRGWLGRPIELGYKDAGGVYARRFENGIVLVNGPGASRNFPLDRTYKRIAGSYDTSVNSGAGVSGSISVPAKDGRFLLNA